MTGDSDLGCLGRRKENAQKVAMRSKEDTSLVFKPSGSRVMGENSHDLSACRENGIIR